jgi:thiol-disulfide isomerase/thioredoxin
MSTFDGAHLYLFTARIKGDSLIRGRFYSTGAGYEVWRGKRDARAKLPNAYARVGFKPDAEVSVQVLDTLEKRVDLNDPRFAGKPVILQISGTWCPNCMDETQFLSAWYKTEARKDIEILGLFFERKPDPYYWKGRIGRVSAYQKVPYLMGYAGPANKDSAATRMPFLTGVEAFPTTVFLNRRHKVVAVHTGYSGPATGEAFNEFKREFNELIARILQE